MVDAAEVEAAEAEVLEAGQARFHDQVSAGGMVGNMSIGLTCLSGGSRVSGRS